jgi:hypothetical protein
MASTRSIRQGQIEIGIIEHEGQDFAALGATVVRRDITGYLKFKKNHYWLTTWAGRTMFDCRSEVVERYWNGGLALMFRLPRSRFVVGNALGGDGMLFRGELIDGCTEDQARHHCRMVSENWIEVDAEDEEMELTEV